MWRLEWSPIGSCRRIVAEVDLLRHLESSRGDSMPRLSKLCSRFCLVSDS